MTRFIDVIEGVEEFNLRTLLSGNELNVVHQKKIHVAVLVAKLFRFSFLDGLDHFIGEVVALDIGDFLLREPLPNGVADRPEQMSLSETGIPVDEKRIVVLSRIFGDGDRGGMGKLVGVADNEIVEGISGHLREIVVLSGGILFVFLIPDENQKIEVAGKQIGQVRDNDGGKTL